jgi:4-amino-4-deoxy-L-arabinose transferase-like glycosyltransferase
MGGPIAAIQKSWHWPGQSVLYSVVESFFCLKGGAFRELVLRLPTLGGMLVAAYLLYRLAEEAIGNGAGIITVVLFVLNPVAIQPLIIFETCC